MTHQSENSTSTAKAVIKTSGLPHLPTPRPIHSPLNNCLPPQEGVDPGVQDGDGNSALMYAAAHGHREALLLVLAAFRSLHRATFHGEDTHARVERHRRREGQTEDKQAKGQTNKQTHR